MRVFIALCLFAAASAAFVKEDQILIDDAVADFMTQLEQGPGLAEYLGVPETDDLLALEKQTQTELGNALSQQLQAVLAQIQSAIDHGQMVGQSLIDKAKELFQNLQQIGGNTVQLAQQFISELIQLGGLSLGNIFGKRSAASQVQQILANITQQVTQVIDKIIAQLQSLINTKADLIGDLLNGVLSNLLSNLNLGNIPIVGTLLQGILGGSRAAQDPRVWNLIVDSINSIVTGLGTQFQGLKDWIKDIVGQTSGVLQGHMTNIKELASQVLSHVNGLTSNAIDQAIEFFRPYQNDLGVLWQQLLDAAAQIHGSITGY